MRAERLCNRSMQLSRVASHRERFGSAATGSKIRVDPCLSAVRLSIAAITPILRRVTLVTSIFITGQFSLGYTGVTYRPFEKVFWPTEEKSLRPVCIVVFTFLALLIAGCGGSSSTPAPTPTPVAQLALTSGNWDFAAASSSGPNFLIGGNIVQTGTSVTGGLRVFNSACITRSTPCQSRATSTGKRQR